MPEVNYKGQNRAAGSPSSEGYATPEYLRRADRRETSLNTVLQPDRRQPVPPAEVVP
jgi:hypothetical protein